MSEGAKKLAIDLTFPGIEEEFWTDTGKKVIEQDAAKIDAAVAPLVTLTNYAGHRMTCRRMERGGNPSAACDCGFEAAEKAATLDQWRTGR